MTSMHMQTCTVNRVFSSLKIFNYEIFKSNIFIFYPETKIFLYVINLRTYIVEYGNYTELWLSKMQYTLVLEGIVLL